MWEKWRIKQAKFNSRNVLTTILEEGHHQVIKKKTIINKKLKKIPLRFDYQHLHRRVNTFK